MQHQTLIWSFLEHGRSGSSTGAGTISRTAINTHIDLVEIHHEFNRSSENNNTKQRHHRTNVRIIQVLQNYTKLIQKPLLRNLRQNKTFTRIEYQKLLDQGSASEENVQKIILNSVISV